MILLLAGTSDARLILQRLKENHAKVAVSVTTEYGAALLHEAADLVNQNRLDACGLQQLFDDWDISLVVDATHPYAAEASKNALAATHAAGIPYYRFERASVPVDGPDLTGLLHRVKSEPAARRSVRVLVKAPGTIQLDERRVSVIAMRAAVTTRCAVGWPRVTSCSGIRWQR